MILDLFGLKYSTRFPERGKSAQSPNLCKTVQAELFDSERSQTSGGECDSAGANTNMMYENQ